jgi:ligand-binding sensor domain-containing protein
MKYLVKKIITCIHLGIIIILSYSCEREKPDLPEIPEVYAEFPLVKKEDTLKEYSPEIKFEISGRLLEGKRISCIEPNYKGNTWIASGSDLYYFKGDQEKIYNIDYTIRDISIAGDETLWIATSGGLGHISDGEIKWYTTENYDLPRNSMFTVEVGRDGRIWFGSCGSDLGGLIVYDGIKFEMYTPDNSILNQHVICNIEVDHNGSVYVVSQCYVNSSKVYRIKNNSWDCLGDTFYYITSFTVGPESVIYLLEDFALSSELFNTNTFYEFRNDQWRKLAAGFMIWTTPVTAIKADRRNYCWAAVIEISGDYSLYVFDGAKWVKCPEDLFYGDMITTIRTDQDNNIWIGTANNGVFILEQ